MDTRSLREMAEGRRGWVYVRVPLPPDSDQGTPSPSYCSMAHGRGGVLRPLSYISDVPFQRFPVGALGRMSTKQLL